MSTFRIHTSQVACSRRAHGRCHAFPTFDPVDLTGLTRNSGGGVRPLTAGRLCFTTDTKMSASRATADISPLLEKCALGLLGIADTDNACSVAVVALRLPPPSFNQAICIGL